MAEHIPTIVYIPKAMKIAVARELGKLVARIKADPSNPRNYTLWFMFSKCIFPACKDSRQDTKSALGKMDARVGKWSKGKFMELWEEAKEVSGRNRTQGKKRRKSQFKEKTQQQFNADRAKKAGYAGRYNKAMETLVSHGMAEES